ncbi:MAG: hypothetical protein QOJ63_2348 [Solirubrobacteraceae bacterium]|nr:hypothetical protein [Solirubrobacteraceae bacterium]
MPGHGQIAPTKVRRGRRRLGPSLVTVLVAAAALPAYASAIERPATPATFSSVFSAAGGSDTILLGPGDYGRFTGATKGRVLTLRSQPGASARMRLDFSSASNVTIDGLTLGEIAMQGSATKHVTVRNSTITGQTVLRTGSLADADILFDGNRHGAWDKCGDCAEGRLFLPERTGRPSGITIRNSRFGPGGNSDGIQNGSNGTRILDNEFVGIKQVDGSAGVHADSIQLYGSANTVIQGNWFHDVSVGVMCADGCDHEQITDNVFAVDGSPYAMTLLSDDGSTINHNTFSGHGRCDYDAACGVLYLGNKSSDPPSRGTIVKDNVLTKICVCDGSAGGLAEEDYNLMREGGRGAHDLRGSPAYVGGTSPSSYAAFALAGGSRGKGDASDGLDRGARIGAPPPVLLHSPAPLEVRVRVLSRLGSVVRTGRLRLEVRTSRAGRLTAAASVRLGPASSRVLRLRAVSLGVVEAGAHRVTARLSSSARRRLARARSARISVRVTIGSQSVTRGKLKLSADAS